MMAACHPRTDPPLPYRPPPSPAGGIGDGHSGGWGAAAPRRDPGRRRSAVGDGRVNVSLAGLRAIAALAVHGSMTAAAGTLGYTPSAVSQQIARLERDVRQVLIERRGRTVTLTDAGRIMAESAGRVINELEAMSAQLQAHGATVRGELKVAAFATAARGLLPRAVRDLTQAHPELTVQVLEVDSHRAVELVTRGSVDLAIAHDWKGVPLALPEGMDARQLGDDVSDVLVPVTHRLAGAASVDFSDLVDEAWLYEPGSVAHDFLLHAYRAAPEPARFGHMVTEYASQIEMVGAGLGLALVPRMGRGPLPEGVRALTVASAPVRRIYGVWRAATGPRPALQATLQTLADALAGRSPTE